MVENMGDDLWIGVKGQANSVIAGSPRNSFRASVADLASGGKVLDGLGPLPRYRILPNSEYRKAGPRQSDSGG